MSKKSSKADIFILVGAMFKVTCILKTKTVNSFEVRTFGVLNM